MGASCLDRAGESDLSRRPLLSRHRETGCSAAPRDRGGGGVMSQGAPRPEGVDSWKSWNLQMS